MKILDATVQPVLLWGAVNWAEAVSTTNALRATHVGMLTRLRKGLRKTTKDKEGKSSTIVILFMHRSIAYWV